MFSDFGAAFLLLALAAGAFGCAGPEGEELEPSDAGAADARYVCGPASCSGCCERNVCQVGNRETACGNSGAQCAECGGEALCGSSKSCEPLDPNRFTKYRDGGAPSYDGGREQEYVPQNCASIGGQWICW